MTTLDELERLEKAATPGPWEANAEATINGEPIEYRGYVEHVNGTVFRPGVNNRLAEADAALIAAARNALPEMIKELRALRTERVLLRNMLSDEQLRVVDEGRVFDVL